MNTFDFIATALTVIGVKPIDTVRYKELGSLVKRDSEELLDKLGESQIPYRLSIGSYKPVDYSDFANLNYFLGYGLITSIGYILAREKTEFPEVTESFYEFFGHLKSITDAIQPYSETWNKLVIGIESADTTLDLSRISLLYLMIEKIIGITPDTNLTKKTSLTYDLLLEIYHVALYLINSSYLLRMGTFYAEGAPKFLKDLSESSTREKTFEYLDNADVPGIDKKVNAKMFYIAGLFRHTQLASDHYFGISFNDAIGKAAESLGAYFIKMDRGESPDGTEKAMCEDILHASETLFKPVYAVMNSIGPFLVGPFNFRYIIKYCNDYDAVTPLYYIAEMINLIEKPEDYFTDQRTMLKSIVYNFKELELYNIVKLINAIEINRTILLNDINKGDKAIVKQNLRLAETILFSIYFNSIIDKDSLYPINTLGLDRTTSDTIAAFSSEFEIKVNFMIASALMFEAKQKYDFDDNMTETEAYKSGIGNLSTFDCPEENIRMYRVIMYSNIGIKEDDIYDVQMEHIRTYWDKNLFSAMAAFIGLWGDSPVFALHGNLLADIALDQLAGVLKSPPEEIIGEPVTDSLIYSEDKAQKATGYFFYLLFPVAFDYITSQIKKNIKFGSLLPGMTNGITRENRSNLVAAKDRILFGLKK